MTATPPVPPGDLQQACATAERPIVSWLAAFRHTQAEADYRYRLRLLPDSAGSIEMMCWRRHPATSAAPGLLSALPAR
jgi:hypothetical protein